MMTPPHASTGPADAFFDGLFDLCERHGIPLPPPPEETGPVEAPQGIGGAPPKLLLTTAVAFSGDDDEEADEEGTD